MRVKSAVCAVRLHLCRADKTKIGHEGSEDDYSCLEILNEKPHLSPENLFLFFFSFCMDACFPWSVVSLQVLCLPRLLYGFSISVDVIAEHWWYCVRTIIVVSLNFVHVWMSTFPNFVSRVSLDPFAFLDFSIPWLAPSISLSTKRVFWPFYLFVDIFSLTNDKTYRAYDK